MVLREKRAVYKDEKSNMMDGFQGSMALRGRNLEKRDVRKGKSNVDVGVNEKPVETMTRRAVSKQNCGVAPR